MNNMKRSIRRVFWMLALCFFLLLGYLGKLVLIDREAISTNAYNTRMRYDDKSIRRGDILDSDGAVIATSVRQEDGTYRREYPRARMVAHVTGYSSVGKTGVEAAKNFQLMHLNNEIVQRASGIISGKELVGNSVALTIDMDIQSLAGDLLGSAKGAIVVMDPSTGRILALQAYPDFDPNTVEENWSTLKDREDSPLVNRATQGLYPPGSTFKLISALSIMQNISDWETRTYECSGSATFNGKSIRCYNHTAHGLVNLADAMRVSCNCYFAEMMTEIGGKKLTAMMRGAGMDTPYGFELAHSQSSIGLAAESTESELVETAIGQGRTLVTPLYMAMFASAIANDGVMMKPYIIDHLVYENGNVAERTVPKKLIQICTAEEAAVLREMMLRVVESGTGTLASVDGLLVAGKTGTAQNATGNDHSWFIGFAPADDPQVAVAVIIEDMSRHGSATPIAGKMLKKALEEIQK